MTKKDIVVSVVMITYGHEKYIEEAINGVFMQQTDFPVELIIANDCSPDRTDEVVEKLLTKAPSNVTVKYTRHESNLGMMPNFIWALQQVKGKYIALCEGDDYWIDPFKLQKQVDFLEKNEDCSMVFSNADVLIEGDGEKSNNVEGLNKIERERYFTGTEILDNWTVPTASVMFRTEYIDKNFISLSGNENLLYGDIFLFLYLSNKGKIFGMKDSMVAYRRHNGGVTNVKASIEFDRKYYNHLKLLINIFGAHLKTHKIKNIIAKLSLSLSLYYFSKKKYFKSLTFMVDSAREDYQIVLGYLRTRI